MRVGIVGAGFAGLTAGLRLLQQGCEVNIFEASSNVGGLASGFSLPGWEWPVERFYHHIFTNDQAIIHLSHEIGCPPLFFRPLTAVYVDHQIYPFDSAIHLLRYPHLAFGSKLRMGMVLAFLKLNPFWKPLERLTAHDFLINSMGNVGYEAIWKPLLAEKFGPYAHLVNAAWFWARIQKRTPRLGYFEGGFQGFADQLNRRIQERGGLVFLNCAVHEVRKRQGNLEVVSAQGIKCFDAVVVTVNTTVFLKIINGLPRDYRQTLERLKSLDALNVLLILRKRLMDRVYWLNVLDPQLPFVGMMEHTNMIHPRHYGGEHIIYLGGYFPGDHRYFQLPKNQIVGLAINQLKHMAVQFTENDVLEAHVHQVHHAQPVIPINYSSIRPSFITPIRNLFLANMDMIYPWDRGTNYAVDLGNRVAKRILKS